MANFTFDYELFSDLYKDAYNIRPHGHEFYDPKTTDERRQEIWDFMLGEVESAISCQRRKEIAAAQRFEARIAEAIEVGAADRETAIRWLMDADDAGGDISYFEYLNSLEYGYISGVKPGMMAVA